MSPEDVKEIIKWIKEAYNQGSILFRGTQLMKKQLLMAREEGHVSDEQWDGLVAWLDEQEDLRRAEFNEFMARPEATKD